MSSAYGIHDAGSFDTNPFCGGVYTEGNLFTLAGSCVLVVEMSLW